MRQSLITNFRKVCEATAIRAAAWNGRADQVSANADAMPRILHGSYTGDGEASQFIPLAAQPQVLIVTSGGRTSQGNIMYGGVVFPTVPSESVTLGETGFTARGGNANSMARANLLNTNYQYLAIYW